MTIYTYQDGTVYSTEKNKRVEYATPTGLDQKEQITSKKEVRLIKFDFDEKAKVQYLNELEAGIADSVTYENKEELFAALGL